MVDLSVGYRGIWVKTFLASWIHVKCLKDCPDDYANCFGFIFLAVKLSAVFLSLNSIIITNKYGVRDTSWQFVCSDISISVMGVLHPN